MLDRADYNQLLGAIQNRQICEKIELLRQHPVFGSWKKEAVEKFSYYFKVRSVREKQVLFAAGQPVNEVFLIRFGAVPADEVGGWVRVWETSLQACAQHYRNRDRRPRRNARRCTSS